MEFIVIARDLKWKGERLQRGKTFEALTDRDQKLANTLKLIGKADLAPPSTPVRKVASVQPPLKPDPAEEAPAVPEPEPAEAPAVLPVEPLTTEDMPLRGRYNTRRLKAED